MWRIRIDSTGNRLALEVRDPDLLLTHFYTLDATAFTLSQLPLNSSKAWWQGLEDTQDGKVYLHGYGDRKTGQHKGVTALAAESGAVLWEQGDLVFYGIVEEGLLAYEADAPEHALTILDADTGKATRAGVDQQEAAREVASYSQSRYHNCVFPVLYKEGEPYFDDVCNFLRVQSGFSPVRAVAYAETSHCIVVSYYEAGAESNLDNFVAVYDLEGRLVLKVKLGSGLSGIGSDTFFIFNLRLYLLLDRRILQVYRLLA